MAEREERRRSFGLKVATNAQRYFILLEFVLLMFTMIYLLYLVFGTVSEVTGKIPIRDRNGFEAVFDQINFLLLVRISILFVVVFLINVLFGLFYLHRLVGPLSRIRSVLTQIADGHLPAQDVVLRKGDFPTDVADELSRAIRKIREYKEGL